MSAPKVYVKRPRRKARQRARYAPLDAWAQQALAEREAKIRAQQAERARQAKIQAKIQAQKAERRDQRYGASTAVLDFTGRVIFTGSRRDADRFIDRYGHRVHADVEVLPNRGYCVGDRL